MTLRYLSISALALAACSGETNARARAMAEAEAAKAEVRDVVTVAPPAPIPSAQDFVARAAASDAFEVASGRLAQASARNSDVRAFAAMLVADHTTSSQKLAKAVAESGHALAAPAPAADLGQLPSAPQEQFDRRFMEAQVRAHEEALARLQAYAEDGDVPSLKAFAAEAAGVVRQHLQHARGLLEQLR
ncbi:DUF4142 domain-containing protein [Phenylobacterium sp.]|uniref:DUF4142 domain-containing protein n=1 Tax=Phenylobacterium sp. TaxID=1871053 RepID=UPI002BFAB39B|nr:DUF4142 domain-containing protein [Phenylobacterium sp.]HVI31172.1 DUF4142 domain-containing protein [Phenylobacterium sp.]